MSPSSLSLFSSQDAFTKETVASSVDSVISQDTNPVETQVKNQAESQLFLAFRIIDSRTSIRLSFCIYNPGTHTWKTYESRKGCDPGGAYLMVSTTYRDIAHAEAKYFEIARVPLDAIDAAMESVRTAHTPHAARKVDCSRQYVKNVVHNLNKAGFLKTCHAKEAFDTIHNYWW
ncbi:hypothetical protein FLAG1_11382 [Fusarium langsethiae]|uniref:Uncharacterized protein n=1 Tax=Fusarium langsethiae TaxID=179993 RepID=A0A0N0DAV5_FUSLA|nr:hypothetical protein FLAG1_11382 [Fusarium langsethiae]GKU06373.1 unnamed protein product [Fusarium langsethiae]GKU23116.1 unnamed protein product [Fusarium langsethiae]